MKIGIDARLWGETGVGRYTQNLIKNLLEIDKQNEYILFVLSKDQEEIRKQLEIGGEQLVVVDIRWHSVAEQKSLPNVLEKANLDLMHFPYFSVPLLYKKPFVVTIHDLILHHFSTGEASTLPLPVYKLKHSFYKQVVKSAAKRAKKVITVSEATKKEIIDHLGVSASKVVVTYEGFDLSKQSETTNSKVKAQSYFLHVGNVYPHKNTEKLVEAFEQFRKTNPDVSLVFVGKDDYFMKRLRQSVERKRIENIVFSGEVSDEELSKLYANAIALVVPSLMEGFGLPSIEAMAKKCLVMLSDIPAHKEIVGNAGIYFDPNSISDIAETLVNTYSIQTGEKEKKIREGLDKIKEYSWKKMAQETRDIYESCFSIRSGK